MPIQLSWTGPSRWHASFAESSYLCNVANCFPAIVTINQFLDPRDFRQLSQSCGISYLDCHVVELRATAQRLGVDPEFTEVPFQDRSGINDSASRPRCGKWGY